MSASTEGTARLWRAQMKPLIQRATGILLAVGLEPDEATAGIDHVFETCADHFEEHELPRTAADLARESLDAWWALREGTLSDASVAAAAALDAARKGYDEHAARGKKLGEFLARVAVVLDAGQPGRDA